MELLDRVTSQFSQILRIHVVQVLFFIINNNQSLIRFFKAFLNAFRIFLKSLWATALTVILVQHGQLTFLL